MMVLYLPGEEGSQGIPDVEEAGGELDAVLVEVEAVGLLGAGDMLAGDAELLGGIEDGFGAEGAACQTEVERVAGLVGDYGVVLGLEGNDGDSGVLEDIEVADIAPEIADSADAIRTGGGGGAVGEAEGEGAACARAGSEDTVRVGPKVFASQQVLQRGASILKRIVLSHKYSAGCQRESKAVVYSCSDISQGCEMPAPLLMPFLVLAADKVCSSVHHQE